MTAERILDPGRAVLLVVDIQEKFLPVIHEMDRVVKFTRIMIEAAKLLDIPILVSEQYPKGLGRTAGTLLEALPKEASVLEKTAFGCLGDVGITERLKSLDRRQILVCGIETHVCVSQTVHQLLKAGYEPHLIQETISSRDPRNREIGLSKMIGSGAVPSCVEMALFELMGDAKHKAFKPVQALVK